MFIFQVSFKFGGYSGAWKLGKNAEIELNLSGCKNRKSNSDNFGSCKNLLDICTFSM